MARSSFRLVCHAVLSPGCPTCLADAAESAVLIEAQLWPVSERPVISLPAESPAEQTLPAAVERSTRLLDRITFALAVVITPLALYFALQAIPYLFRAITTGRP